MDYIVNSANGKIRGHEENGLLRFLGIPFAKAPKGELRFKRAVPAEPWEGILEAAAYGDPAPQDNHREFIGTEDCLTINVVRQIPEESIEKEAKKPVFVWIHGGGYNIGSACDLLYRGDAFANDGLIYVNFQYRLNALGVYDFTTFPGTEAFESNCALSDMICAIKWVHENIAAFGGDPDRVTIAGESAGAAAVMTLMAVPAVEGMFSQVISESGLCNCVMTKQMQHRIGEIFLEGMGWNPEDNIGKLLKEADPYDLVKGHNYVEKYLQYRIPGTLEACPVIDDLLPERPLEALAKGASKNVRLIIGTNLHEGTMFVRDEGTTFPATWEMIEQMFANEGHSEAYPAIRAYYSRPELEEKFLSPFVHFATDYAFQMPSTKAAIFHSRYQDTRVYRFEYLSLMGKLSGLQIAHAFELGNVFAAAPPIPPMEIPEEEKELDDRITEIMHGTWVRFIKGEALPEWPLFTSADSPVMVFGPDTHAEVQHDRVESLELWGDMRFYEN